jgi:Trypsin-co-occurring domain 2
MELKDFIRQTLVEIAEAVAEANKAVTGEPFTVTHHMGDKKEHGIEFDVAVTAKDDKQAGGKANLGVAVLGLSTNESTLASSERVSRIKFTVGLRQALG